METGRQLTAKAIEDATIVGAGPAGLAAAIALAQGNVRVSVIERASEFCGIGAGLQITPNGAAILRALGLEYRFDSIGDRASAVEVRDFLKGTLLFRFDLERYCRAAGSPYLLFHRADLVCALAEAARELGVKFHLGKKVESVVFHDDSVECKFDNGEFHSASFLVGADGTYSVTRQALNGIVRPRVAKYMAWRALIPADRTVLDMRPEIVRIYVGPGCHVVIYWIRDRSLLNVVAVEKAGNSSVAGTVHSKTSEDLSGAFWNACETVERVLEASEAADVWALHDGSLANIWTGGRIALIGDALHPILPTLAQGANQAFEDAWVLARELRRQEKLPDALCAFRQRRGPRLEKILRHTTRQVVIDHLALPPARHLAHKAIRLIGHVRPSVLASRYDWLFGRDVTAD